MRDLGALQWVNGVSHQVIPFVRPATSRPRASMSRYLLVLSHDGISRNGTVVEVSHFGMRCERAEHPNKCIHHSWGNRVFAPWIVLYTRSLCKRTNVEKLQGTLQNPCSTEVFWGFCALNSWLPALRSEEFPIELYAVCEALCV